MNFKRQDQYEERSLPKGYLEGGYFELSQQGNEKKLKKELVMDQAKELAKIFGRARPELKRNQLRKFYDYSRNMEEKLRLCKKFSLIETDILKLEAFAADAKSKGNIPEIFYDFIKKNIECIKTEEDFTKGFIEHFQAVVAYFSYYNPRA